VGVDIGEELVGAYLTEIEGCDHVLYNVRARGGGQRGLKELDIIGLKFMNSTAYLCEVTTHLEGLLIGKGYDATIQKIRDKHAWQVEYAQKQLGTFKPIYQFWSPRVPKGNLLHGLEQISGLELVVNSKYKGRIDELRKRARDEKPSPTSNMAYRLIQILEHLK
jgi:hypothetical protein